jgi:hypothetical protein
MQSLQLLPAPSNSLLPAAPPATANEPGKIRPTLSALPSAPHSKNLESVPPSSHFRYYEVVKNWGRIKRHLDDRELNQTLVKDFNLFTFGRWGKEFKPGMFPDEFESCDWRLDIRGRHPAYFRYVKHRACHWLCNFNLRLATLVAPKRSWRVVTSTVHSTVWDGAQTLFDLNSLALGVPAPVAWERASKNGRQLPAGENMKLYLAKNYKDELRIAS